MNVFVAVVGMNYEGGTPVGVYESYDAAIAGLREYADRNECYFAMNDYYEVYEYELGAVLDARSSNQDALVWGEFSELLEEAAQ